MALIKITIVLCALFTVAFCDINCPANWVNTISRCYYYSTAPAADYYDALRSCDALGGHLLSIETQSEHDSVTYFIESSGNGWWTSGTNNFRDKNFGWFGAGRPVEFKNFCNGNEDGSTNHCVILDSNCSFNWTIVSCDSQDDYYYICERDIIVT